MLTTATRLLNPDLTTLPGRNTLSPKVVARLQPIRLVVACWAFSPEPRRIMALHLIKQFFPEHLPEAFLKGDWVDTLWFFLGLVDEQKWFELDWHNLEVLYEWYHQEYAPEPEEEYDSPYWIEQVLRRIPARCYGFCPNGDEFDDVTAHPPLELLNILLTPGGHQVSSTLRDLVGNERLYALEWDKEDQISAWQWLGAQNLENSLPEPLCWLLEVARYACGETGNGLLDTDPCLEGWEYFENSWTAENLEYLQAENQEAQTILEHVRQFEAWARGPEEMQWLFDFLTGKLEVIA